MIKIESIEQFKKEFGTYEKLLEVNDDDGCDTGLIFCSKEIFEKITGKEIDNEIDDGTSKVRCINCGCIFFKEKIVKNRILTINNEDTDSFDVVDGSEEYLETLDLRCSNCEYKSL